jgi:hypothetical protein
MEDLEEEETGPRQRYRRSATETRCSTAAMNASFRLEFITPLFSRGAYDDRPEIRAASIRGQLHAWFRALGGSSGDEKSIFGGVHGGAVASKVVVRVKHAPLTGQWIPTLPHKPSGRSQQDGPNAPRIAVPAGTSGELHVLSRLGGLDARLSAALDRTLESWLLLGALGLRSTRGGGSFRWSPLNDITISPPPDFFAYEARCHELLESAPARFALLPEVYRTAEQARRVVADTLGGPRPVNPDEVTRLRDLRWPLGDVASKRMQQEDRTRKDRKTSPLRFRIVGVGQEYRIAALWDARDSVTKNRTDNDLPGIIKLLAERKPALGRQLAASRLA